MCSILEEGVSRRVTTWDGLLKRKSLKSSLVSNSEKPKMTKSFQKRQISLFELMAFQNLLNDFLHQDFSRDLFAGRRISVLSEIWLCTNSIKCYEFSKFSLIHFKLFNNFLTSFSHQQNLLLLLCAVKNLNLKKCQEVIILTWIDIEFQRSSILRMCLLHFS